MKAITIHSGGPIETDDEIAEAVDEMGALASALLKLGATDVRMRINKGNDGSATLTVDGLKPAVVSLIEQLSVANVVVSIPGDKET